MTKSRSLAAFLWAASLPALPQSAHFTIAQHGHPVGTASLTTSDGSGGRLCTSLVKVSLQGLEYSLSESQNLSLAGHLRHAQIGAVVNGSAVNVTAAADSAQYLLNISANGRAATTRLDLHPAAVLLADFDPGALQILLDLANSASGSRSGLWAILPKQSVAGDGSTQPASIEPIQAATYRDEQGTLDGKPIAVHHLIATIADARTEVFSGPGNRLLQAELPQGGFAIVREGFVLTPPARPIAPAAE